WLRSAAAETPDRRTDRGHGVPELDRVAPAGAEQPRAARRHVLRSAADVDHDLARDVTSLVVVDARLRQAQAVADEFGLAADRLFAARVGGKRDAGPGREGLGLTVHRDGDAGVPLDVDAEDLDDLEVAPVVTGRLDVPLLEMVGDIGGSEPEPLGVDLAPLELVGRDIREPIL